MGTVYDFGTKFFISHCTNQLFQEEIEAGESSLEDTVSYDRLFEEYDFVPRSESVIEYINERPGSAIFFPSYFL